MRTQNIRVTKKFTFSMAHALYGHDGPCRHIHGHTYSLYISILGSPQSDGGPKDGMVIDFANLKELVESEVIGHFDHALVLNMEAEVPEIAGDEIRLIRTPFQPTCENLLLEFRKRLIHFFDSHHCLVYLKLEETPTSYAEWRIEDN